MKPNLIFILLDGARWDRLHISKEFQDIVKNGTLLTNVTSAMPYTFGAMNIIFTGLYGKENGVDGYYKVFQLNENVEYLPEILQNNGYFTSKGTIHERVISSRGFDLSKTFDENSEDPSKININLIEETFEKSNGKPIFSFFQYSRIHTVTVSDVLKKYEWDDEKFYSNSKNNLEKLDNAFIEAGIHAKKIVEHIEKLNKKNDTIIVFFTDHGTGIGERFGERNYGSYTYEETIRTFYLFLGTDIRKNRINHELLSSRNICPTLLDLCKTESSSPLPGVNLGSFLRGKEELEGEKYTFSETGALHGKHPSPEKSNVFCIKTKKYKLIYFETPNEWELYDLENDPHEKNNLIEQKLDIENELKEKLLEYINR